jgi:protein-disulfide isomerase
VRDLLLLVVALYLVAWSMTMGSVDQFLARNDVVVVPSAKRLRDPQGRRKYEAELAEVETRARSRSVYLNGSLALVGVLIVVVGIGVQSGRAKITGTITATNASVANGVVWGKKAAATVDVYEDFGCPACLQFEKSNSAKLQADVRANLVQLRVHPIAILDGNSPNQYSTRAADAALCASDISTDAFIEYHNLLYGSPGGKQWQPKEGTSGPTNSELITLAKSYTKFTSAQITSFGTCVNGATHKAMVEALTENASKRGINGTPTVYVNGKKLASNSPTVLDAAIAAADAKGPAPSPSPTPSPTPSTSAAATSPAAKPSTSAASTPAASPS